MNKKKPLCRKKKKAMKNWNSEQNISFLSAVPLDLKGVALS